MSVDKTSIKDLTGLTENREGKESLEVDIDADVLYTCIAMTDPQETVRYTWRKDGQVIKDNSDPHLSCEENCSILRVKEAKGRHSGNYTCVASNGIDQDHRTIQLKVKGEGSNKGQMLCQLHSRRGYRDMWFIYQGFFCVAMWIRNP